MVAIDPKWHTLPCSESAAREKSSRPQSHRGVDCGLLRSFSCDPVEDSLIPEQFCYPICVQGSAWRSLWLPISRFLCTLYCAHVVGYMNAREEFPPAEPQRSGLWTITKFLRYSSRRFAHPWAILLPHLRARFCLKKPLASDKPISLYSLLCTYRRIYECASISWMCSVRIFAVCWVRTYAKNKSITVWRNNSNRFDWSTRNVASPKIIKWSTVVLYSCLS